MKDKHLRIDGWTASASALFLIILLTTTRTPGRLDLLLGLAAAFILGGSLPLTLIDRLSRQPAERNEHAQDGTRFRRTYAALLCLAMLALFILVAATAIIRGMGAARQGL